MSRRILVPVDAAPQSESALDHAIDVYPDATLVLLHVLDPRSWISSDEFGDVLYSDDVEKADKSAADELLSKTSDAAEERGITTETVQLMGRPAHMILEYASENDIDGIVMGSHGRTGLDRIFLGSVAEAVARRASVPITIVH